MKALVSLSDHQPGAGLITIYPDDGSPAIIYFMEEIRLDTVVTLIYPRPVEQTK